jgi:hypothetical protein
MSLKEELKTLQTRLEAGRPVEVVVAMHRAVDDLRTSGARCSSPSWAVSPSPAFQRRWFVGCEPKATPPSLRLHTY